MSTLDTFKNEFDQRHDFEDPDIQLLYDRHADVEFSKIPVAWVMPIDEMLCRFRYNRIAKEVRQEYGQLIVTFKNRPEDQGRFARYQSIVDECEGKLRAIDIDLHAGMKK